MTTEPAARAREGCRVAMAGIPTRVVIEGRPVANSDNTGKDDDNDSEHEDECRGRRDGEALGGGSRIVGE